MLKTLVLRGFVSFPLKAHAALRQACGLETSGDSLLALLNPVTTKEKRDRAARFFSVQDKPAADEDLRDRKEQEQPKDTWKAAMDRGDWDAAWDIFSQEQRGTMRSLPSLEEIIDWDPNSIERQVRRKREEDLQESASRARVQTTGRQEQGTSHGVGKRKTSVARVWLREGNGHLIVNKQPYDEYFMDLVRRNDIITPFIVSDQLGRFDMMAIVGGGGVKGQAEAIRHGVSRALQNWDPTLRNDLKDAGLLTRDPRKVERKKAGRKKARKSFQWVKR